MRPRLVRAGLALFSSLYLFTSLGAAPGLTRYDVRVWQTDDGLPQNTVFAIAQTPDGYLWVGTHEGLVRFDGVRFSALTDSKAAHLRHTSIRALCVGRDGALWVASENGGLTRIWKGDCQRFSQKDGLPDNQIQCLFEGRDGSLWAGGETGLSRFQKGRFSRLNGAESLQDNSIKAIDEDANGILRVATVTGLVSIDSRSGEVSTNNFGLGSVPGILKAVQVDRAGRLWVGKLDGLICLSDGKVNSYAANKTSQENIITTIVEDRSGQLWVGHYAGLGRRYNAALLNWWTGTRGVDDLVFCVFEDSEGNIWVGGRDGLYRLNPVRMFSLTKEDGLVGNNVVSILEDRSGAMWFAVWGSGVVRLKDGYYRTINQQLGLSSDKVLSLHEGNSGAIWIGAELDRFQGGVDRLTPSQTNAVVRLDSVARVIFEDEQGKVWVGTGRGLSIIEGTNTTTFTMDNGLSGNNVTAILQDRDRQIWIGTDRGVSRWSGNGFVNITVKQGLPAAGVNALYQDERGNLWIGTRGGGLSRWREGKVKTYTSQQGLFSDEIFEILEDNGGHLWMSCRRGIFRVNLNQFDALDRGELQRLNCTSFGREDGLATVQCSGVAKPGSWKSRDGRLWFATIRGAIVVESRISINEQPPTVAIEEVVVDGHTHTLRPAERGVGSELDIPPGSGRLEIHFTALSLQAAEKNRFKYRLDPFDEKWIDVGHQRIASYLNVPPRRYQFRVIACNNDGVWNETGAALELLLQPHFWQTWWFKALMIALPIAGVGLFYRARVDRLRELENLRIRIAADLHDDVGSRLTKVAMVTELADRETAEGSPGKPYIQNITRTVREITRAMDEIVWTINPRNDTLENLANYIFHYAQEYFQSTGVRCRLDLPPVLPDLRLSTEARHNLFMAVREALNNILKHASATEVRIALMLSDEHVTIEVKDNGRGIAAGRPDPTGEGMKNMRVRLEKIGGEFKLRSRSDGTTITLQMPRP